MAGVGIARGVQARTRPRRDAVHRDGPLRRSQRRSCPAAAMRPVSLSGTGLWPAERGPCRRPWRRSGEYGREARVRGRRGVSPALPPFFFHCPPCPLPPVVRPPSRADSVRRGRTGGQETGRWERGLGAAALLAASATARRCSAGSATCNAQPDPTGPANRRLRLAMRHPIRGDLDRRDVERGDILLPLPAHRTACLGIGARLLVLVAALALGPHFPVRTDLVPAADLAMRRRVACSGGCRPRSLAGGAPWPSLAGWPRRAAPWCRGPFTMHAGVRCTAVSALPGRAGFLRRHSVDARLAEHSVDVGLARSTRSLR